LWTFTTLRKHHFTQNRSNKKTTNKHSIQGCSNARPRRSNVSFRENSSHSLSDVVKIKETQRSGSTTVRIQFPKRGFPISYANCAHTRRRTKNVSRFEFRTIPHNIHASSVPCTILSNILLSFRHRLKSLADTSYEFPVRRGRSPTVYRLRRRRSRIFSTYRVTKKTGKRHRGQFFSQSTIQCLRPFSCSC